MDHNLKRARQEKRLTREELARKAGIPVPLIAALESGEPTVLTVKALTDLAEALDKTVEEIFLP